MAFETKNIKLIFHTQNIMNEKHLNLKKNPAITGYLDWTAPLIIWDYINLHQLIPEVWNQAIPMCLAPNLVWSCFCDIANPFNSVVPTLFPHLQRVN